MQSATTASFFPLIAAISLFCTAMFTALPLVAWAQTEDDATAYVSIAGNGQVIVRNAVVQTIENGHIVATTFWNNAKLTWTVLVGGSTRFSPIMGSKEAPGIIRPGDTITFSGLLDTSKEGFSVVAGSVKDTTLLSDTSNISGVVSKVDSRRMTLTVATDAGTTTIAVDSRTPILLDGATATLSSVAEGYKVKVFGRWNALTKTLAADKVTVQPPRLPNTGVSIEQRPLWLAVIGWLTAL